MLGNYNYVFGLVLSDPHKRAIYDSLGTRGLETEGWEIVQRTKTPQEIREEYERLARLQEERRLQQRTSPKGSITVNINASDVFSSYDDSYIRYKYYNKFLLFCKTYFITILQNDLIIDNYCFSDDLFSSIQVSGMTFTQSIEAPLTTKDTLIMYGQLSVQNGTGSGTVNVAAKRLVSTKGWIEADIGVGSGPTLSLKGFRTLTRRIFCTGDILIGFTSDLAKFGLAGCKYFFKYLKMKMYISRKSSKSIQKYYVYKHVET